MYMSTHEQTTQSVTIPSPTQKTIYIYYLGGIDEQRVNAIIGIVTQLMVNEKPDVLYFLFSSNGGGVDAGVTLYNYLKSLPIEIVMHNIGSIDSIANVVFMAGKKRYASPHAVFLFHGVVMNIPPSGTSTTTLTLPIINEMRDRILNNHNTIAGIVCGSTKIRDREIKRLFSQGQTKDVRFALQKGIIDKIQLPQMPQNPLIVAININS